MKKCTKPLNRLSLTLLLICFVWFAKAQTATFPFPQNYNYTYGIKATNSDPTVIQARFADWKAKYYVESGTQARIKYLVLGEDGSATLSEGIGYGMLIMVYMDNTMNQTHACFDKLYNYYKANVDSKGLLNSKATNFTPTAIGVDPSMHSNTSADIDVAQALLLAFKQWNDSTYLKEAKSLLSKINTIGTISYPQLSANDKITSLVSPSNANIAALNSFAKLDVFNIWHTLAQNQYTLLKKTANATTGLVPDWAFPDGSLIGVGSNVGDACASIANAEGIACDQYQSYFLNDAVKTPWRMAQTYAWYGDVDAKNIAGAIANWSNTTFSGDPSNAFDGYNLDGTVISGLTTGGFTTKGTYHNALFAGGLGISGMVDAQYQNFVNTTWTKASMSEGPNSQYSTATPQLLFLLLMSGNMPNLLDMTPAPLKAYNNSTGGCNTIYVSFNKALNESSVTASTSSWSITTNNASTPITIAVNSVALSNDGKTLALSLAVPTEDPLIKVSYSAISKISSVEGKMLEAFTNMTVEDVNACARAYPAYASTNIYSDTLRIVFSKSMLASSFVLSDFSVKVNGTSVTPLAVFADANDPTMLVLKIGSGIATSTSKITVSYTKGSLKSLDGGSPNLFSDYAIINAIPCACCKSIETFEMLANKWTTWGPGTMSTTTTDPVGTSVVGKFTKAYSSSSMSNQYVAVLAELPKTTSSDSTLNARMLKNAVLKMRVYVSKAGAAIRVRLQDKYKVQPYATSLNQTCTVAKANTWTDVAFDFSSQLPTTTNLNEIQIDLEPDIAISVSETMYFDDIQLCPVPAITKVVHGNTSIDDSQIKLECNTEMSVPTNFTDFTIVPSNTITSIAIDPNDNKSLLINLALPFTLTDAITISYSGNTVKGLNGLKLLPFSNMQIVNLMGRTVANGWIDNFNVDKTVNSVDVTQNIGGDNLYTRVENISGIGTYSVTAKASTINSGDYNSWGPNVSPVSSAEVWDISADPVVRFSVAIPAGETVYVRADVVDLVNNRATDGLLPIKLIADGQQHSYTIDFTNKLINNYGITQGPVDAKNIVTVNLYQWKNDTYPPKLWTGTAVYDWLSVGSTIKIYNTSTDTVALETNAHATSSADGEIYLVPSNTARAIETLKDVVSKGLGVKVTAAKDVAVSIPTTNLTKGSYIMYAFNPSNNDLSRQSNEIQINALSPCPLFTPPMPQKITVPLYKGSITLKTGYQNAIWFTNNNSIKTTLDTAATFTFNLTKADTTFLILANPNNDKKCPYPSIPYYITVTNDLPFVNTNDTVIYLELNDSIDFTVVDGYVLHSESLPGAIDTTTTYLANVPLGILNGIQSFTTGKVLNLKALKFGVDTIKWQTTNNNSNPQTPTGLIIEKRLIVHIGNSLVSAPQITYNQKISPLGSVLTHEVGDTIIFTVNDSINGGVITWYSDSLFTKKLATGNVYKRTLTYKYDNICYATRTIKANVSKPVKVNILVLCKKIAVIIPPTQIDVPYYKQYITLKNDKANAYWTIGYSYQLIQYGSVFSMKIDKPDTSYTIFSGSDSDVMCSEDVEYKVNITNKLPSSKLDTTYFISLHDSVVFSSIYSTVTHDSLGYTNSDSGPWFSYHVEKESLVGAMDTVSQISLKKSVFENGTFIYTLKPKKIGVDTIIFIKADSSMIYGTSLYLDSAVVHGKKWCYMIIHITPSVTDTCPIIKMNPVQAKVCSSNKSLLSVVSSKTYTYDYKPQNVNPIDTIVNYKIKYVGGVVGILHVDTGITVAFNNGCKVSAVMKDTSFTFVQSPSAPKVHDFYYKVNEDKILYLDEASGKNGKASWYCPSYGKIMFLGDTITVNGISTIGDYPFTVSITDTISKCSSNESGFTLYIKDTSYISCPKIAMEAVNIPICTPEKSVPECWAIQYHYSYIPQGVEPVDTLYSWAQYTALEVGTHTVDYTVVFNNACKVKVSNTVNVTLHQTPKFPTIHEFNYDSNAVKTLYLDSIPNSNCIVRWHRDWVDYGLGNSVLVPFDSIGKYMIYITLTDTVEKCSSIGNTYLNIKDPKLPSISGTVNAGGNPFSNGTVQLFEQNGADYTAVAADSIHTDGTFTFKWLKTTKYLVRALPSANQNNYVPSYYVNAIQWQDASVIDLKGKIMGLDLTLVPKDVSTLGTGSISGTVDLQDTSFASKQKALYSLQMTVIVMKDGKVVAYGLTDFDGNYSINNLADGNYDVYVEMPGYTKWTKSVNITNGSNSQAFFTLKNGETTSVTDVPANTDEVIYPNPASDNISISTNKIFKTIQIINVDGVFVIDKHNPEKTISVANLPSGFYIIKMISDNQTIIKTFVKQ